jgi:transposase
MFSKMGVQISGKGVKKLTIEEKATIIVYRKTGMKTKDIIARTGRNTTTITRVVAASRELQNSGIPERKKGSGRPRKVTKIILKSLERQIDKYPTMTASQLRATVPEAAVLSHHSVQRDLQKDLKMPSRVAALKPLLMEKMKKRLTFCQKYKHWTAADWESVMYSGESTFCVIRAMRTLVRRPVRSNR